MRMTSTSGGLHPSIPNTESTDNTLQGEKTIVNMYDADNQL